MLGLCLKYAADKIWAVPSVARILNCLNKDGSCHFWLELWSQDITVILATTVSFNIRWTTEVSQAIVQNCLQSCSLILPLLLLLLKMALSFVSPDPTHALSYWACKKSYSLSSGTRGSWIWTFGLLKQQHSNKAARTVKIFEEGIIQRHS